MVQTQITKITPNEKQMQCIKTVDGPVMVLAGPGRVKHLLLFNVLSICYLLGLNQLLYFV